MPRSNASLVVAVLLCAGFCQSWTAAGEPKPEKQSRYEPPPWHLVDIWWDIGADVPFESLAFDVTISEDLPASINFYIAPIGLAHLSGTPFYGGIQTQADGYTAADAKLRKIGPGFLFSMWGERSAAAIRPADDGYFQSSGHEGDFVSARRPFAWNKGKYTYRVVRMDRETIGEKTYTWVGAFVFDHRQNQHLFVGALRFPGEQLSLKRKVANFVEVYGPARPVSEIPKVDVTFGPPVVNGVPSEDPSATADYPSGVPDYANVIAHDNSLIVRVGAPVDRGPRRKTQLIPPAP